MGVNQNDIIFSKVFIVEHKAEDDCQEKGIKSGDVMLSLTWREAVKQEDGSYTITAYGQKLGESACELKPLDIEDDAIFPDKVSLDENFTKFANAYLAEKYDIYDSTPEHTRPLDKETIDKHRVKKQSPAIA